MSEREWVLFLLIVVLYAAFAKWLGRYSVTMPLVLVASCALLGPGALGWLNVPATATDALHVTEITLALLLFADASTLRIAAAAADNRPAADRAPWSGSRLPPVPQ